MSRLSSVGLFAGLLVVCCVPAYAQPYFTRQTPPLAQTYHSGTWAIRTADLDDDGDQDVLGAEQAGQMSWFENVNGAGSFTEHIVQPEGDFEGAGWRCWTIFVKDIDFDGDLDIVGGTYRPDPQSGQLCDGLDWWENVNGDASAWERHNIDREATDQAGYLTQNWVEPEDIDDDGDYDLVVANHDNVLIYYCDFNQTGLLEWTRSVHRANYPGTFCARPFDLDGNGPASYSIVTSSYYLGKVHVDQTEIASGLMGAWGFDFLDADQDSDFDIAIESSQGLSLLKNESLWPRTLIGPSVDPYAVRAADMNNDGLTDLVAGSLKWFKNNGGASFTSNDIGIPTMVSSIDVADINGDGKLDIAEAHNYGGPDATYNWWKSSDTPPSGGGGGYGGGGYGGGGYGGGGGGYGGGGGGYPPGGP